MPLEQTRRCRLSFESIRCCLPLKARLSALLLYCSLQPERWPQPVSGDCSTKQPNKSPVCGVEVAGRCEGNKREDEVRVLSVGESSGGSSNVRNMTCARDDESLGDNAHKRTLQCELEKREPHARDTSGCRSERKNTSTAHCISRCTFKQNFHYNLQPRPQSLTRSS